MENEEGSQTETVGTENTAENLNEEELYIEETQSEVQISEQQDPGSADPDAPADTVLIESVQEVATKDYVAEDVVEVELYVNDATEQLDECGLASNAGYPEISLFSSTQYVNSYGEQLSGDSIRLYNQMVDVYVLQNSTETIVFEFENPYFFQIPGTIEKQEDGTNKTYYNITDIDNSEEYQIMMGEIRLILQNAFNAFVYDYPEAFWLGTVVYPVYP
ncbi:MAG: hypothetical protein SOX32_12740, partial [Candidatus Choladocola sp.]|nr:hypothetical protein [Candidatus Choladocola sp.]